MKKIKIIIVVVLCMLMLVLVGKCTIFKKYFPSKNGVVIEYKNINSFGTIEGVYNYYTITLYNNKMIKYGNVNDEQKQKKLSDYQYDKIIKYAFSSRFSSLEKNQSDPSVLDGSSLYVTLYYEDGTVKSIGGSNPSNKRFLRLVRLLNESVK